jgi:signal recognition particle receptor subunit beta
MVQFNLPQREIVFKIVYYGPALSGKTTNLQIIHQLMDPAARGRLMTLDTADERTLFFDMLPMFFRTRSGFNVRLELYTVPGQVMHGSARRIVLSGADGVVFVADSQLKEAKANQDAWNNMRDNLKQNGIDADEIPMVVQFNKRDLPGVRSDDELETLRKTSKEPLFPAVAVQGQGVLETLHAVAKLTFRALNVRHDLVNRAGMTEAEFLGCVFHKVDLKARGINLGGERV